MNVFTSGPWISEKTNYGMIKTPENVLIASVSFDQKGQTERDANARLILAAPEMLSALEMVMSGVEAKHAVEAVRAAINKAKGEME